MEIIIIALLAIVIVMQIVIVTKANAKILDVQNKLDKAYVEVGKKYLAKMQKNYFFTLL